MLAGTWLIRVMSHDVVAQEVVVTLQSLSAAFSGGRSAKKWYRPHPTLHILHFLTGATYNAHYLVALLPHLQRLHT